MICINCKKNDAIKYSDYSNGKFCSKSCARSFSSKEKRDEINEKIKKSFSLKEKKVVGNICVNCKNLFRRNWNKRHQKFCSRSCNAIFYNSKVDRRDSLRKNRIEKIKSGVVNGNGIKSIYIFNGSPIKCESNIERACLNYFDLLGATSISRCDIQIEYKIDGESKIYLPDFKIILDDRIYIVEAKGKMHLNTINKKWRDYNRLSLIKKEVLIRYCEENGYTFFWFTPNLNSKYYRKLSVGTNQRKLKLVC